MKSFSFLDPAFLARCVRGIPYDDMESYTDGATLDGLVGGYNEWAGVNPYVARENYTGLKSYDDLESYSNAADVNGLNGGTGWTAAFVSRHAGVGIQASDDMESYSDGAGIDGLNGGERWTGAYVGR